MRTLSTLAAALLAGAFAAGSAQAAAPIHLAVSGEIAGPDGGWDYLSFDPVHRQLYVSRTDGIMAVDVDTGKVTPQLVAAQRTHMAVPVNDGDEVAITSTAAGAALIADAKTGVG